MIKNITTIRTVGFVSLGLLLSGCGISGNTYGTGTSVESGLGKDLTRIATFGRLGNDKNKNITYRQRSALVIPSKEQLQVLPPPGSARIQPPAATNADGQAIAATTGSTQTVTLKELEAAQNVPRIKRSNRKGVLAAVGIGGKSNADDLSAKRLIDVPPEYRTVQSSEASTDVDELLGKKKKEKKKRFGIF